MMIDMTAELNWLIPALLTCLALSAVAVATSAWRSADPTRFVQDRTFEMAIVGGSPSVPATAEVAPSDTSVSEAA
ncbi:MAG: hypothetical protein ACRERC_01000 [Candidatus Binatia bacterium]